MKYIMLFQVPNELGKEQLKEALSHCCNIQWLNLSPDMKNPKAYQHGKMEAEIVDQVSFDAVVKKYRMSAKVQPSNRSNAPKKESQNRQKHKTKEPNGTSPHNRPGITREIANPSFHFYKSEAYGKHIESYQFDEASVTYFALPNTTTFALKTRYPGLLVGAGYMHPKLKTNTDDFQLGFFFDHTTGLPLISGSSIKGLIRSRFPSENNDRYAEAKKAFLQERYGITYSPELKQRLFESTEVCFYDAYISKANSEGKIFGSDYITSHHSNEPKGLFKEPNPVRFLKVLPEVTFTFQFKATQEEATLFQKILVDFGIGAKTNVGYGQFEVIKDVHTDN